MMTYIQDNEKLLYPDQDAINEILRGKIKRLDQKWNNQVNDMGNPLVSAKEGGIFHYIGNIKPWHLSPNKSNEIKIYYEYWDKYKEAVKNK